ncbi:MAG TPA: hypothetical protein VEA69_11635 [Tepidisphaeraceae bacterium]|nr:hypothetical protein [Tepidisphaeraceae bacterium]
MDDLKGPARTLLACQDGHTRFELALFADGSLAIRKAGHTHSVWEPDERDDCLRTFGGLVGLDGPHPRAVVVMVPKGVLGAGHGAEMN